jgi:hypothetical protein
MSWHEVWHVIVLGATLLGAGAGLIYLLGPVVFEGFPEGMRRGRPWVLALVALAVVLVAIEWLLVH